MNSIDLRNGDCLEVLKDIPDNSVDSIVTDPPYGINMMGKKWDYDVPSEAIWTECLRVLKPGGHLLAFAGTRTQHRMAVRIEDAGFEIRDMIAWVYGCLSDDTEILTENGWMLYDAAKKEKVLTYDVQKDVYKWEKPARWNEYRVESDTAYRIQSDHTDQIVSRGHRCIVERSGVLEFVPADELAGVECVPYLRNDFSALPKGCGELLLHAVFREGEGMDQAVLGEQQGQEVPEQGHFRKEKSSMEWRCDLCQTQGQVRGSGNQVRAMSNGNDEHGTKGWVCHGASSGGGNRDWQTTNADGVCSPHQPRRDGQSTGEPDAVCDQFGSQTVRIRTSYHTTLATITAIQYSGMIWCPTVSTGAFVARRNGKIFITGNSGMPKTSDISKAIDKSAGVEREVLGIVDTRSLYDGHKRNSSAINTNWRQAEGREDVRDLSKKEITAPSTEAAKQWQGWSTSLKPSLEPITVARKPLIGTVVENVLQYGTGAMNIDGCRVETENGGRPLREVAPLREDVVYSGNSLSGRVDGSLASSKAVGSTDLGRWPANFIHDGSDEVLGEFPLVKSGGNVSGTEPSSVTNGIYGEFNSRVPFNGYDDNGSAARFFYCAKTSRIDRHEGVLDHIPDPQIKHGETLRKVENKDKSGALVGNTHMTVKPTSLMQYLCRLVTPPNGTVLDPFMGSGSTGKAAMLEGFKFIGIEREVNYFEIAKARIEYARDNKETLLNPTDKKKTKTKPTKPAPTIPDLFEGL